MSFLKRFCILGMSTLLLTLATCQASAASQVANEAVVIVAPSINEPYYASVFEQTIAYDILFVNTVREHLPVVLVVDEATHSYVTGKVPEENILIAAVGDIWVRDFSPVFPNRPVKFSYRPNYLSAADASWIENSLTRLIRDLDIEIAQSDIVLDGGNFVHNGADKAVITTRVFADNPGLTAAELEQELFDLAGITTVAYTPEDEGDTTGHSDGQVMWIDENTLMVNEYDEPVRTQMLSTLQTAFPSATIIEVPIDYTEEYFGDFASACGLHVNSLVTDNHILLPTYNQANDAVVQAMIEANTSKTVVPIDASNVCFMGGAVRCLTWYVKGSAAQALVDAARGTTTAVTLGSAEVARPSSQGRIASLFSVLTLGTAASFFGRTKR